MDDINVQPQEPVSPQEPVPATTEPAPVEVKPVEPEPLNEERIRQMIADAVGQGKEFGKRELQSRQDRNRADMLRAERRVRGSEQILETMRSKIKELDPDAAKDMELAELRARAGEQQTLEREDASRQQAEVQAKAIHESIIAHLKEIGIDPNDKRVDWADDAMDYITGRSRFDASVASILKADSQTKEAKWEQRLRDIEAKIAGANVEANSVPTDTSGGVAGTSDADFIKKFGNYELPDTKENRVRYNKILAQ